MNPNWLLESNCLSFAGALVWIVAMPIASIPLFLLIDYLIERFHL